MQNVYLMFVNYFSRKIQNYPVVSKSLQILFLLVYLKNIHLLPLILFSDRRPIALTRPSRRPCPVLLQWPASIAGPASPRPASGISSSNGVYSGTENKTTYLFTQSFWRSLKILRSLDWQSKLKYVGLIFIAFLLVWIISIVLFFI